MPKRGYPLGSNGLNQLNRLGVDLVNRLGVYLG